MTRTRLSGKNTEYLKKNYILIFLIISFVLGMVYGSLIVKSQSVEISQKLAVLTKGYAFASTEQSFLQTLVNSFFSTFLFVLISYLFGYSAISQAITVFIPLFKGLGLGLAMGYLYNSFGLTGIGYCFLIIVPQTVISMFAIFLSCRESVKLSNLFLASINKTIVNTEIIKLYNIKFIVLTAIAFGASIVDAISVMLFSNMFKI